MFHEKQIQRLKRIKAAENYRENHLRRNLDYKAAVADNKFIEHKYRANDGRNRNDSRKERRRQARQEAERIIAQQQLLEASSTAANTDFTSGVRSVTSWCSISSTTFSGNRRRLPQLGCANFILGPTHDAETGEPIKWGSLPPDMPKEGIEEPPTPRDPDLHSTMAVGHVTTQKYSENSAKTGDTASCTDVQYDDQLQHLAAQAHSIRLTMEKSSLSADGALNARSIHVMRKRHLAEVVAAIERELECEALRSKEIRKAKDCIPRRAFLIKRHIAERQKHRQKLEQIILDQKHLLVSEMIKRRLLH